MSQQPGGNDADYDVVVAGAGIAGMAAAIEAAEAGARVLVIEKDKVIGGNARWALGYDIEGNSFESMRSANPDGDPILQQILVERFPDAIAWLEKHGVEVIEAEETPGRYCYAAGQGDGGLFAFAALQKALYGAGGIIRTETALRTLKTEVNGSVVGLVASCPEGLKELHAGAVVIATGSFGHNAEMKQQYLGAYGCRTGYYGTDHHDGDGIIAALAVGAGLTAGMSIPAGACVFPPPFVSPEGSYRLGVSKVISAEAVPSGIQALILRPPVGGNPSLLLNIDGKRYVDELAPYTQVGWKTTLQRFAVGFCIFDQRLYDAHAATLECALENGALIYHGDSIELVAERLGRWRMTDSDPEGIDVAQMIATVKSFNAAVAMACQCDLTPPHSGPTFSLDTPPFYATPVVQGISDMAGGLSIDQNARVRDIRQAPIPGLFAAGADGGHPYSFEHGGLASALIFGRIAGSNAVIRACSKNLA